MGKFAALAAILGALEAGAQTPDAAVRAAVAGSGELQGAKVSVFAKNLDSGASFSLAPDEPVRTASTIKVAIMAAAFASVAEGKLHWTDPVILHNPEKVGGAGVLAELDAFTRLSIRDLIHLMIVVSDNTATNLVLSRIPADEVNARMERLGLHKTRVMRKILGDGAPGGTSGLSRAGRLPENARFGIGSSTPREMVDLLEKLEQGRLVNKTASAEMISILKRQQDRNGIPRRLGSFPIANKTGALDHLRSDVGIVYTPAGRIAMAITCDEIPEIDWSADNPGYLLIAKIAEILTSALR